MTQTYKCILMLAFPLFQITRDIVLGYILAIMSILFDTTSLTMIKLVDSQIPKFQLNFMRYFGMTIISSFPIWIGKYEIKVPIEDIPAMTLLRVSTLLYDCFIYGAVSMLPLLQATGGRFVTRMIFVAIYVKYFQKPEFRLCHILGITISVGAIALILQPWSALIKGMSETTILPDGYRNQTTILDASTIPGGNFTMNVAIGSILVSSAGASDAASLYISGVQLRHISPFLQTFITGISCSIATFILTIYNDDIVISIHWTDLAYLSIYIFCTTLLMWTTIASCRRITASRYSIVASLSVLTQLTVQCIYIDMDILHGCTWNIMQVIGCCLLLASAIFASVSHSYDVID